MQAQYIITANGGVKLTSASPTIHPLYVDPSNPSASPEEVRQARYKAELAEVSTYAAILRSESVAKGEGTARESSPWDFGKKSAEMPIITSAAELADWLMQDALISRPSAEDSDTGLHVMCYRLCFKHAWMERVNQSERWGTIATDAAANVVEELFRTVFDADSTILQRGKNAGKTRIQVWLENWKGAFPVLALVGTLCRLEVLSEMKRAGVTYNRTDGLDIAEAIESRQIGMEQGAEFSLFIGTMSKAASAEEKRNAAMPKGTKVSTVRQDIFKLYKLMLFNADIESSVKTNGTTGNANRDVICETLAWTRRYHRTIMTELRILLAHWEMTPEAAKAEETRLREALARNNA